MTWLKIGDEVAVAREWLAIDDLAYRRATGTDAERAASASAAASLAKLVHLTTSMWGARALCDGVVQRSAVAQICALASITPEQWSAGVELLQAARMWDARRSAPWRMIVMWRPGDQPTEEEETERKRKGRRRTALLRKDLPAKLDAIARAEGCCEYCDDPIDEHSGEIDHVDPAGWNDLDNLAHVCTICNRRKGARSLKDARMEFTRASLRRRAKWSAKQ